MLDMKSPTKKPRKYKFLLRANSKLILDIWEYFHYSSLSPNKQHMSNYFPFQKPEVEQTIPIMSNDVS